MDLEKTGALIRALRMEQNLTQRQLAEAIGVSDKAISKWERGMGYPDISILPLLSSRLDVDLERLLSGTLDENELVEGNMKKLQFYVCPTCGNLITTTAEAGVTCCGKKLTPLSVQSAKEDQRLSVEVIDQEYFISSDHPMDKGHFISFVAFVTGDTVILRKLYPEWDMQARLPMIGHGMLFWYCTQHGLFRQII